MTLVISCATFCVAAATAAYAQLPDPEGGAIVAPPSTIEQATPAWEFVAMAALGVILALAVVGLITSLRHQRRSPTSQSKSPPLAHG
jgi:hypothetical protein